MAVKGVGQTMAGWGGNVLNLFFVFSPTVIIWKLVKGKIEHRTVPYFLLISNSTARLLWFIYGFNMQDYQIYPINALGCIVNLICLTIFWYYFVEKKICKYFAFVFLTYSLLLGIWLFCTYIIIDNEVIGYIMMGLTIAMFASPAHKIVYLFYTDTSI
jgi:hypothetical protein